MTDLIDRSMAIDALGLRKEKGMKKVKWFAVLVMVAAMLTACTERQAEVVSRNVSKQADNFNVTRRLTVVNTRTDKCILQMTGKMSIQDVQNGLAVLIELDRDKGIYQKHYVYLNDNTMYTVEDLNGVSVSRYAYEMEFMPQSIVPVRITTNELEQDIDQFKRTVIDDFEPAETDLETEGEEDERPD